MNNRWSMNSLAQRMATFIWLFFLRCVALPWLVLVSLLDLYGVTHTPIPIFIKKMFGMASRKLCRMTGGLPGETLCARWARTRGSHCLPCRIVGFFLLNPDHCYNELVDFLQSYRKESHSQDDGELL